MPAALQARRRGGVGFRLGFQFLVGVLLPAPAGFQAFRFLRREWLACVLRGGKLFQRPGLGRLCRFLTLIPCLVLAVLLLPVGGKTLCFLRREVGSGLCGAASSFKDFDLGAWAVRRLSASPAIPFAMPGYGLTALHLPPVPPGSTSPLSSSR